MRGFRRPFSLADRSIAYPRHADIVTIEAAGIACFVGPAAIILVLSAITPGIRKPGQKRLLYSSWRDKLWDANAGWLGLGLALATTLFVTSGMKAVVGKPRPNFLAICDADVANLRDFVVGGSGSEIESDAPAMVTYEICRQTDLDLLNDAFVSELVLSERPRVLTMTVCVSFWALLDELGRTAVSVFVASHEILRYYTLPRTSYACVKQVHGGRRHRQLLPRTESSASTVDGHYCLGSDWCCAFHLHESLRRLPPCWNRYFRGLCYWHRLGLG
jgi:hypothetical protein